MAGKLITVEGIDGVGKSVQVQMLRNYLCEREYTCITTREPGGNGVAVAEHIRELLLNPDNPITPTAEALLFAAGRAQHIHDLIIPHLNAGHMVISDRFIDSSLAYQGWGKGVPFDIICNINRPTLRAVGPFLTIWLDMETPYGSTTNDRMERENEDFYNRVKTGYQQLAKQFPQRIRRVNADRPAGEVHHEIAELVGQYILGYVRGDLFHGCE